MDIGNIFKIKKQIL